jgi:hypothetical protein
MPRRRLDDEALATQLGDEIGLYLARLDKADPIRDMPATHSPARALGERGVDVSRRVRRGHPARDPARPPRDASPRAAVAEVSLAEE